MSSAFFDSPILNSPYEEPRRHWELDFNGQPTTEIVTRRRPSALVSPIPKAKKVRGKALIQPDLLTDETGQEYNPTEVINGVRSAVDPVRYANSVTHWMAFFDKERTSGRLPGAITVAELTPQLQARFQAWRAEAGVGGHTISRDLAALRGAVNWAWKNQILEHAPFIADVPPHQKAPARDRVLSFEEIATILDACAGRFDREHLIRFIVIELGTAGRPDAVIGLTDKNIDLKRGLINPTHEGRVHTRKRRAIVPIARHVLPWVTGIKGKLIKYRVPIAERNRVPGGPEFFERETKSIRTCWNKICADAEINGASPKTLRHTMLTWLAMRGVPKEQRNALGGHVARDTTARNYEHLSPDYLRAAVDQIDAFFDELSKHTHAHLRYANDTACEVAEAA